MKTKRNIFISFIVGLGIVTGFVFGIYIGTNNTVDAKIVKDANQKLNSTQIASSDVQKAQPTQFENTENAPIDFQLYWDVWKTVKDYYVHPEDLSDEELFYGSLEGIVNSTNDPYSTFFSPRAAEQFEQDLQGSFEGIGAEIGIKDGRLTIISPLADSPAQKAGLVAGDSVFFIDGFDTTGITIDDAVRKIRGAGGTNVVLTVGREGVSELLEITITRDTIDVKSVVSTHIARDNKNYYHIKLASFNEDTKEELDKVLTEILPANPDGIIIDVRNNPGGFLNVAIDIASLWIEDGIVVSEEFSDDRKNSHWARGKALLKDIPTMVLVNQGSASASEILAGALQDHGKGILVGATTFGKGSVQSLIELKGGAALKVTVAQWLTPHERQIDKVGIEPDITQEFTREDFENEKDPQLDKALELFNLSKQQIDAEIEQGKKALSEKSTDK